MRKIVPNTWGERSAADGLHHSALAAAFRRELRSLYAPVVTEPPPEHLRDIVAKLDEPVLTQFEIRRG